MSAPRLVTVFTSAGPAYQAAFNAFLQHTDQKANAFAWLSAEVERLPRRKVMLDAGAGNGQLTARFVTMFERLIAIEPNPSLVAELHEACPLAEVIERTIADAEPTGSADFVLCSHILYYIPRADWLPTVSRLTSWLGPGGVLAIALQNPDTDCMRMVRHFIGGRLDLARLGEEFQSLVPDSFDVRLETVPARIVTQDLVTACTIAEFMLNVLPIPTPPAWENLERYVERNFQVADRSGYCFTCHQDFLRIQRRDAL